jgi:chromosome segregation ATPase
MAKQNINVGTAANDKKGDSLRAAFQKVNANFTELYTALGINADVDLN